MRNTNVFTKNPIRSSSSGCERLATNVPTATSSVPAYRPNTTDTAASNPMNTVAPSA